MPDTAAPRNELDDYLSTGPEPTNDVLKWWWDKRRVFPKLSRMAFDYLTVAGKYSFIFVILVVITDLFFIYLASSTAVERVFSRGRHLLHFTRNRLSGKSIRMCLCLGSWSRFDLINDDDVLRAVEANMGVTSKGKRRANEDLDIDTGTPS